MNWVSWPRFRGSEAHGPQKVEIVPMSPFQVAYLGPRRCFGRQVAGSPEGSSETRDAPSTAIVTLRLGDG